MSRRIVLGAIGLVSAAALVIAGTVAVFHAGVGGAGGSLVAGVLDLRIKNNVTGWLDVLPEDKPTWTMSDMAPGQYMDYDYSQIKEIDLRNASGSLPGSSIDLTVVNHVIDPPGPASDTEEGTTDMAKVMQIVWMEYDSTRVYTIVDPSNPTANMIGDANGNGWIDLDDLQQAPVTGLAAPGGLASVQMRLRYRPEADSDYQGDSLVSELNVTEHQ